MRYREAIPGDIPQMQEVRNSVKENVLSNPGLVTDEDCAKHITTYGKGWICEEENRIIGFAIADVIHHNIWALFVLPQYEGKGVGKALHSIMLTWYFSQTDATVWLSTAFNTRAEKFYISQGWQCVGHYSDKEIKFEMTAENWKQKSPIPDRSFL